MAVLRSVEKRQSPRVPVSMTIGSAATGTTVGFGYACDISARGMSVDAAALATEGAVPGLGSELQMRFKLPKSEIVIAARGRVVRVDDRGDPPRIAFEFVALSSDYLREIRKFIDETISG